MADRARAYAPAGAGHEPAANPRAAGHLPGCGINGTFHHSRKRTSRAILPSSIRYWTRAGMRVTDVIRAAEWCAVWSASAFPMASLVGPRSTKQKVRKVQYLREGLSLGLVFSLGVVLGCGVVVSIRLTTWSRRRAAS